MTGVNELSNITIEKNSENSLHSQTHFSTTWTSDITNEASIETFDRLALQSNQHNHSIEHDSTSRLSCCFSLDSNSNEISEDDSNQSLTTLSSDTSSLTCLSLKKEQDEFSQSTEYLNRAIPSAHSLSAQNDKSLPDTIEEWGTEIVEPKRYVPLDLHTMSVVSTPSSTPTVTKENYEQKLIALSRLAWGTPLPNPLEIQKKETMAIQALRHSNVDILSQYESPFSTNRQKSRKRTISAVLSTPSTVPHLDKRMLSSTYKISLENDKILAKNLGGWDTFFSLKGKLASIPRDQLEYLLLETCCTEPRLISRITNSSIEATNKMIFQSNHLPL